MHILEYENYEETKKHYDTDFSYNTYPCSIPLDFPCVPMHWHRENPAESSKDKYYRKNPYHSVFSFLRNFHILICA